MPGVVCVCVFDVYFNSTTPTLVARAKADFTWGVASNGSSCGAKPSNRPSVSLVMGEGVLEAEIGDGDPGGLAGGGGAGPPGGV